MTKDKSKIVESIIKIQNVDSQKYFDRLIDMKSSHLEKLLKVCVLMKEHAI